MTMEISYQKHGRKLAISRNTLSIKIQLKITLLIIKILT